MSLILVFLFVDIQTCDADNPPGFYKACSENNIKKLEEILASSSININELSNYNYSTALMIASERGYLEVVNRLLEVPDIDVNESCDGNTALRLAIREGHIKVAIRLLRVPNIDVTIQSLLGTVLGESSHMGHIEVVNKLLEFPNTNINAVNRSVYRSGRTALMEASERVRLEVVNRLLEVPNININAIDLEGNTALMIASLQGHTGLVNRLLQAPGIGVNIQNYSGSTALMKASFMGNLEVVNRLLTIPGININATDRFGDTALMKASKTGCWDVVRRLLEVPNIDLSLAADKNGKTALLMWASREGYIETVRRLLKVPNIDVNSRDKYGKTALMWASIGGKLELINILLEATDNVHRTEYCGFKEFMWARLKAYTQVVTNLFQKSPINAADSSGKTALMWASTEGRTEIVRRLLEVPNINVHSIDRNGKTALMWASRGGHIEVVRRLLEIPNINVNLEDRDGNTALMLARTPELAQLLIENGAIDEGAMRKLYNPGLNVHATGRDSKTRDAVTHLVINQNEENVTIKNTLEAYDEFYKYLRTWDNENERKIAMEVLENDNGRSGFGGLLLSEDIFGIKDLNGKSLIGRLWVFAGSYLEGKESDLIKYSTVKSLIRSKEDEIIVCNEGKIQRLVSGVLQGRMSRAVVDEEAKVSDGDLNILFFTDERQAMNAEQLRAEVPKFIKDNPKIPLDQLKKLVEGYIEVSGLEGTEKEASAAGF